MSPRRLVVTAFVKPVLLRAGVFILFAALVVALAAAGASGSS